MTLFALGTAALPEQPAATPCCSRSPFGHRLVRFHRAIRVRFAAIGTGVRGCVLLDASLRVPGAECVAVCDLYDSRHLSAQQALNKSVPATRDYKAILDRKDVDAVIIAVTDHQHRRVFVDACAAGKDVYCEKPMSHTVEDGFAMVAGRAEGKPNRADWKPARQFDSLCPGEGDLRFRKTR